MNAPASALYVGQVGHVRHVPRRHALRYRVFMLLLDLDEAPELGQRLKWLSFKRFNLVSFEPRDHGDGSDTPLREQIERGLDSARLSIDGGPIRLLCLPRILGYGFNPISVYFCHRRDGVLRAILYEVNSTFGERHSYLMAAEAGEDGTVRHSARKRLHVSPFMEMGLRYDFQVAPPGERVSLSIEAKDVATGQTILTAGLTARRRPLDDRQLLAAWAAHPLLTLKVIAGIHWEALKIRLKGVPFRRGPRAPAEAVSLGTWDHPR